VTADTSGRLARYAREQLDDALRTVALVSDDDFEVLYLRDDLADQYTEESYGSVVDAFPDTSIVEWQGSGDPPVGERQSVVYCHENAFVFQFDAGDDSLLMSVEPDVGTKLRTFIDDCQQRF